MLGQTSPFQCCHFSSLPSVSSVLSQPILPSSLPSSPLPPYSLWIIPSLYRLLSGILRSTAMHPCAPPQWPRMTSTFHLTPGNLLTKDFCFFFPFHYPLVLLISSLCSSPPSLTPHPSLFAFCLFLISYPVKWPYQVPRYVSDAAPNVPTLRFGKEMSSKSRLQGRPSSSSTFFPVFNKLSPIGVN